MTTDPLLPIGAGHTELGEDEREGLIPSYIATRGELFEAEERNITKAMSRKNPITSVLLDDAYLRSLHRDMFADVWVWAGRYRTRDTNIGLRFELIPGAVRGVVLDAKAWVESQSYDPDQLALRFHHRLVATHPFPNGNGRHSRLMADVIISKIFEKSYFTWSSCNLNKKSEARTNYLKAIKKADKGNLQPLIEFARL